tara:strand:- start:33 stop:455 length:423 start_codon:yes stop_codon:yes gene_type:complete
MALGDNKAFFNETTFTLGNQQTGTTGISGLTITTIASGAINPQPAAKLLYNIKPALLGETGPHKVNVIDREKNLKFHLSLMSRYLNEDISVITEERLATQFTFHPSICATPISNLTATLTARGFNSQGPTLRRLQQLGYV